MSQLLPVQFQASGQAAKPEVLEEEPYGYENDPYAAQTMFTTYQPGMDVGDMSNLEGLNLGLGSVTDLNDTSSDFSPEKLDYLGGYLGWEEAPTQNLPAVVNPVAAANEGGGGSAALDAIIGIGTAVVGGVVSAQQAQKLREPELAMEKERAELARLEAEAAASESDSGVSWGWIVGGVAVVGLLAGGGYYLWTRKK